MRVAASSVPSRTSSSRSASLSLLEASAKLSAERKRIDEVLAREHSEGIADMHHMMPLNGEDIALEPLASIGQQFDASNFSTAILEEDRREQYRRGRLFAFLTFRQNSPWLHSNLFRLRIALGYQALNVLFILVSVLALVISSEPKFYRSDPFAPAWVFAIEATTVAFFTVDYILKLLSAPIWWRWMKKFLSICDLLSFFPSYVEWIVQGITGGRVGLEFLKILRLFRLFRLASTFKNSTMLNSVISTLVDSWDGGLLLICAICINLLFFSTCIWLAETSQCNFDPVVGWVYTFNNQTTPYQSIAASFYWNIITITTVGYGDVLPVTAAGRVVASLCAISGIIFLAFPLTVFSFNFSKYYSEQKGVYHIHEANREISRNLLQVFEIVKRLEQNQNDLQRRLNERRGLRPRSISN